MNFLGIGTMELVLILAVGLFFVGPRRLVKFIRDFKEAYSEVIRKRNEIVSMVEEELELEEIKKDVGFEEIGEGAKEIQNALELKDAEGKPLLPTKTNLGIRKYKK